MSLADALRSLLPEDPEEARQAIRRFAEHLGLDPDFSYGGCAGERCPNPPRSPTARYCEECKR